MLQILFDFQLFRAQLDLQKRHGHKQLLLKVIILFAGHSVILYPVSFIETETAWIFQAVNKKV